MIQSRTKGWAMQIILGYNNKYSWPVISESKGL